jgi:splicing factor 3B subunit 3
VHAETYGKSGVRRVIPGQYLAADPKGRAVMIASVEKNKLVYVLNRNAENDLTISSPLEAHKHFAVVYDLVGVDVGYENPIFAALEVDYEDSDQDPTDDAFNNLEKQLIYYQLDLGLNHVVRKWTDTVHRSAHKLFAVPGGADGPGGVLVCAEESISYQDMDQETLRVPVPRRKGPMENPERKRHITSGALYRSRGSYFFILQTEDGDLFKAEVEYATQQITRDSNKIVATKLIIKYFGTVPVGSNLVILNDGWLYVATEAGDHMMYYFESRGDDDDRPVFTSDDNSADPSDPMQPVFFDPRDDPEYLSFHTSFRALNPITGCKVTNLTGDDAPQIYTINGSGARSTFRALRHGLEITEVAASALPRYPSAVWTTKMRTGDQYDSYIVLSFSDSSFVLSIGEANVEEAGDTGLITSAPTIAVQALEDAMLQVHPRGIRHIRYSGNVEEWPAPSHRTIVAASTNERQVAIALSSGELVYFEIDAEGNLAEFEDKPQMTGTVTALSLGDVPEGRVRSSFLAVGCDDSTVRILSLDPDSTLDSKSIQAVSAAPTALRIMSMHDSGSGGSTLYLHIGLQSGVYLRTVVDEVTGDLSDTRTRFLGARPVKLFRVNVSGTPAILALASRAWLGYSDPTTGAFMLTPVNYDALDWGWSFSSAQCEEGVVGISGDGLRYASSLLFTHCLYDENKESKWINLEDKSFISNCSY